ncbi:MAG: hypothetical protein QXF20_04060 [Candidatus Hadarchaeales archaeon]
MEKVEERSRRQEEEWRRWLEESGLVEIWKRVKGVSPFPGKIPRNLEIFLVRPPWLHLFKGLGMNERMWRKLKYENFVEWSYRVDQAVETSARLLKHPPRREELYHVDNLCYLSHPPAYLCRPDIGKSTCELLYGKYATVEYVHADDFTGEVYWINGYHNEDGIPIHRWTVGVSSELSSLFDGEDEEAFLTSSPTRTTASNKRELEENLNLRHQTLGIRLKEVPRHYWDTYDWGMILRGELERMKARYLPQYPHSTLYLSCVSAYISMIAQNALTSTEFFLWVYYGLNTRALGVKYNLFSQVPAPPLFRTLLNLPQETFVKRMVQLFLGGYDAFHKYACSKKKVPHLFRIKKFFFEKGPFYPHSKGLVPPFVMARVIPPSLEPINLRQYLETPPNKEFLEVLESEAGLNRETGELLPLEETSRHHFILDPSVELLRPSDFPPMDWNKGQIWPFDLTREKLEIMVEEGYDGSGKNVEYYSRLADRKMGKKVD